MVMGCDSLHRIKMEEDETENVDIMRAISTLLDETIIIECIEISKPFICKKIYSYQCS